MINPISTAAGGAVSSVAFKAISTWMGYTVMTAATYGEAAALGAITGLVFGAIGSIAPIVTIPLGAYASMKAGEAMARHLGVSVATGTAVGLLHPIMGIAVGILFVSIYISANI